MNRRALLVVLLFLGGCPRDRGAVEPVITETAPEPAAMAEAVLELLGDRERREALGRRAREVACERLAYRRLAEPLLALYEGLVGRGKG